MVAEIISIGTEIILGQVIDTNATYLSRRLTDLGIDICRRITVADNLQSISQAVHIALRSADLIILTGGLGPTPDDITAEGISKALCVPLSRHPEAESFLTSLLQKRGIQPSPTLLKQADLPEGCEILPNHIGTAVGIWIQRKRKIIIAMPGVPVEAKTMFEREVVPRLQKLLDGKQIFIRILRFIGIGESDLTDRLGALMKKVNPTLGTSVKPPEVWLFLTAKAPTEEEATVLLNETETQVKGLVGQWLFATGGEPLEEIVGKMLKQRGLTIATAESITGGLVCQFLTDVAGSSEYVRGSIVAYSDGAKISLLSVPWDVIKVYGSVSAECALSMARQVRARFKANIGLATTGYAGPTGGEPDKPIGTVFIAVSSPKETNVKCYHLHGTRHQIREKTAYLALFEVLKLIR